jgi:hypothetical protein
VRLALLAFAVAWLAACETPPSAPASQTPLMPPPSFATTLLNEKVPVAGSFAVNASPPVEDVEILQGFLHTLVTGEIGETSADFTIYINAEDIEGVGLVTGARYFQPANETDEIKFTAVPLTKQRGVRPPLSPDSGGVSRKPLVEDQLHVHVPAGYGGDKAVRTRMPRLS